jgi:hypothetical protein
MKPRAVAATPSCSARPIPVAKSVQNLAERPLTQVTEKGLGRTIVKTSSGLD